MTQHRNLKDGMNLRLPDGMRNRIKAEAANNRRSMNSEIVFHLERIYGAEEVAAGEGFADIAPAAQDNNAALLGGMSINQDKRTV